MVFDFVDLPATGKTLHLVDAFSGAVGGPGARQTHYNTDADLVRRQYHSNMRLHLGLIPDVLPLPDVRKLGFAIFDTGNAKAEAASLPYVYELLSPGGIIVIDYYGAGHGSFDIYDPVIDQIGAAPALWFPSGQCALFK